MSTSSGGVRRLRLILGVAFKRIEDVGGDGNDAIETFDEVDDDDTGSLLLLLLLLERFTLFSGNDFVTKK